MTQQGGKVVEIQVANPVHEYVPGLGNITIVPNLNGAEVYIERRPDPSIDGSVQDCLRKWAKGRREDIAEHMREVEEIERVVRLIDEIREASRAKR